MSLYLPYSLDLSSNEKVLASSFSNTEIPVLAVSTSKRRIVFFQEEGSSLSDYDIVREGLVTALCFHPSEMVLAFGSEDGHLGVWEDENSSIKEELNHEGSLKIVKFNSEGTRIFSSDDRGMVNVWSYAPLFNLCSYRQSYSVMDLLVPNFSFEKIDKTPSPERLSSVFFFTNSGGVLYLADDKKTCPEICRTGGKIKSMLFYEKENAIILITSSLLLVKCAIHFNQPLNPKKIKLSIAGKPDDIKSCWASEGLIAIVSGDDNVRFFYLDTDQSYMLSINDHPLGDRGGAEDNFTCLDFNFRKRLLIVGGKKGKIYMWKCNLTTSLAPVSAESWETAGVVQAMQGDIRAVHWSNYMGLIQALSTKSTCSMLCETVLQKKMNERLRVLQIDQKTIEISLSDEGVAAVRRELDHNIKGMEIFKEKIICWNGFNAFLYEVDGNMELKEVCFLNNLKSNLMALSEDSIVVGQSKCIDIYNFEGDKKDSIPLDSRFGEVNLFNVTSNFLLVCTSNNYFGVYDLTRRNLKMYISFRKFEKNGISLGEIREASINSKGNLILFLTDTLVNSEMRVPETRITLFDVEMDAYVSHEISGNRIPVSIDWDFSDPRIFAISTEYARDIETENYEDKDEEVSESMSGEDVNSDSEKKSKWLGPECFILAYTAETGINQLESHRIFRDNKGVFAIAIPDILFISQKPNSETGSSLIKKKFQFFQGLNEISEETKNALKEFTLHMASGRIDDAYRIVRGVKSENIWENMAKICIKTKRPDVLEVCLSNMRFERGIRAFREARHEKEPEAKLAMVAMHLNMFDEAKKLLKEVNRFDVLIKFYISMGDFELAVKIAKENDRIDLQNTYYRIAERLEEDGEISEAVKYYKLSGLGAREIPRMFVEQDKFDELKEYLNQEGTDEGFLWLATFFEKNGKTRDAIEYYKKAHDVQNIIRLLLKAEKLEEAKKICEKGKQKYMEVKDIKYLRAYMDGAFLIGKHLESKNDIKNAIVYYGLSGRITHAFRLAREHGLDNDIYALGLKAPKNAQNTIAEYFEKKGLTEKAINLYLLGSNIRKGLNLCLATNQYDKVREISEQLQAKEDKDTLKALADYFIQQNEHEKALGLLIRIKNYEEALKICENYKVQISKETADAMLQDLNQEKDNKLKMDLTSRLAQLLMSQGEFEIAHDINVKIGDLKRAMKCYIKMGNKDKVVEFAHVCRNPEIFILAANFMQNLEWTPEVIKIIVSFYSKAKAYLNLANFYINCSGIEATENKNFSKAEINLKEAMKVVQKVRDNGQEKENKINEIENRLKFISGYSALNTNIKNKNIEESIKICEDLIELNNSDYISKKQLFAILFKLKASIKKYEEAYQVLVRGKQENNYVGLAKPELILDILKQIGKENEYDEFVKK